MSQALLSDWIKELESALPVFGHRNWIVIADAAYPSQTAPGIRTIVSSGEVPDVAQAVLDQIADAKHIRAKVILDSELFFLNDKDAPGAANLRRRLLALLDGQIVVRALHEQIIARLDEAGKTFNILLIKTKTAIPYTSVFLELDCGYWSAEAEGRLRADMAV